MNFRVFKKSSPNGKITVYLGKRDFVDHITHVDPIGKLKCGFTGNFYCNWNLNQIYQTFSSCAFL